MVLKIIQTVPPMKENLSMGNNKGKERIGTLMVHTIKANGSTQLNMGREFIEKEILSMMANGDQVNQKDKASL